MGKRSVVAAVLAVSFSGAAIAGECPRHMKAIDDSLAKNPALSAQAKADVSKLRAEGEAAHKAGKHSESMTSLAKAKQILGI